MKKTLYIGRDPQSDIVIPDSRDIVSRCHAVLYIDGGKMFIEDRSKNGTYINGVRINIGTCVPISRKDNVSLAHVAELDWSRVPNPAKKTWIILIVAAIVVSLGILSYFQRESIKGIFKHEPDVVHITDTLHVVDTVTIQKTIEKVVIKESSKGPGSKGEDKKEDPKKETDVDVSLIF